MTSYEIKEACSKFQEYLEANGVSVMCHAIYIEEGPTGNLVVTAGEAMLLDTLMVAAVDRRGWKVVPK